MAKLLETGLVNLSRIEVLWKPVTAHLLEVGEFMISPPPPPRVRIIHLMARSFSEKCEILHENRDY